MTQRKLHISEQLSLPLDVVTSTTIVYGGKGMGKTNLGSVLAEECAAAGLRFAVIDPMGVWWGLRHSADGKGPGIEVLILGGIHGDIPIEPTGGAVVADLVVDEDANVVIDISRRPDGTMWSIAERVRFVTDYSKRLYQRQGERRRPILQFYDEAARFVPQVVRQGEEQVAACMGAIAVLVEEGRNVAIGVCLLTQRSARLNKDVAELADSMIAFRTVGPNSRRAVLDWLGEHVEKEQIKVFDQQLRALPRGSALVVSPGWLEYEGVVAMRMRQTFDSSATPKPGEKRRVSGPGAKPDLAKYQHRMAQTIEQAKANDPKLLKQRIGELERKLAKEEYREIRKGQSQVPAKPDPARVAELAQARVDVHALQQRVKQLTSALERFMKFIVEINAQDFFKAGGPAVDQAAIGKALEGAAARIVAILEQSLAGRTAALERARKQGEQLVTHITKLLEQEDVKVSVAVKHNEPFTVTPAPAPRPVRRPVADATYDGQPIAKGEALVLRAIAQHEDGTDREQLTVLTGYKKSSRDTYLKRLAQRGLIESQGDRLFATSAGVAALGADFEPLPTGDALREYWLERLGGGEQKILQVLITAHPDAVARAALEESTGYKKSSRDTYLKRLMARELVEDVGRGEVRASDRLFDMAAAR